MFVLYLEALALLLAVMTGLWLLSVRLRDASVVDPAWGALFVISVWFYYISANADGWPARKLLIAALVTIWGLRLSLHLLWRKLAREPGEDFRYQAFRRRYGPARYWWISLFQVFWLQGALAWLIGGPLLAAQCGGEALGPLDALATLVWLVGFVFEAGADLQLARFKARRERHHALLTTGFWRYTRHPNYFGDAACWWGYGLLAVAAGHPLGALGALLMTFLLVRVSGVALLERSLARDKPDYADYARRTSAFLPWFPRR